MKNDTIIRNAWRRKTIVPAFNIPYLPMMEPVVEAARIENAFCFVAVARLEWEKFESRSMAAVYGEYSRFRDDKHVRIHLDHIPVIDEDDRRVPYMDLIREAIELGYESVMIDGSRLSLEENITATREVVDYAHKHDIPVEGELGAVMGHEANPAMKYEEILKTRSGFTSPDEARRFVKETGCDWLSVAFGNIHGAVSEALRHEKKVAATLDIEHLDSLQQSADIPLVLHGGSGIPKEAILQATAHGIAKINIGTEIRQAYEQKIAATENVDDARNAVYERTRSIFRDFLKLSGNVDTLNEE